MPEHDMVIANDIPSAVQTDINNALAAIVQFNSKAGAPTDTFPHMIYADTTGSPSQYKVRNAGDSAFTNLFTDTGLWRGEDGAVGVPAWSFAGDTNTGAYRSAADTLVFVTGGVAAMTIGSSQGVIFGGTQVNQTGSAGTPPITFFGDLDTGVFRIGADNLGFATGGGERVDISDATTIINNILGLGTGSTVTLATGVATITASFHFIDTQSAASTDDCDTISAGTSTGQIVVFQSADSGRDVTFKHATDNIRMANISDYTLASVLNKIAFIWDGSFWRELFRTP